MAGDRRPDAAFWRGRSVFLTGHTGFVGGWLGLWLAHMGARVVGYSLDPPTDPSFFAAARIGTSGAWVLADIRDVDGVRQAMAAAEPEIAFHLAAQPLVRAAFVDPHETWTVNVAGTVNVLEAARATPTLRALVVVTSDKVYAGRGQITAFCEDDPLGGQEPYALSKAGAELAVAAYRASAIMRARSGLGLATARAGNIIGGGDWGKDRLVPDAMRAFSNGTALVLRKPDAVRPWQLVLDAVSGLLMLGEALCRDPAACAGAWNLGPADTVPVTVAELASRLARAWGEGASWRAGDAPAIPETERLEIDSRKAAERLGWRTRWPIEVAIVETVAWYRAFFDRQDTLALSLEQIGRHIGHVDAKGSDQISKVT
jgi:CDP-glucose 4,6-dehydratase